MSAEDTHVWRSEIKRVEATLRAEIRNHLAVRPASQGDVQSVHKMIKSLEKRLDSLERDLRMRVTALEQKKKP